MLNVKQWLNRRGEAVATLYEKGRAVCSITFATVEQRTQFIKRNQEILEQE